MKADDPTRATRATGGGDLVIEQWYLDVFYDTVEELPSPSDDPAGWAAVIEDLETTAKQTVELALEVCARMLAEKGMRVVIQPR